MEEYIQSGKERVGKREENRYTREDGIWIWSGRGIKREEEKDRSKGK